MFQRTLLPRYTTEQISSLWTTPSRLKRLKTNVEESIWDKMNLLLAQAKLIDFQVFWTPKSLTYKVVPHTEVKCLESQTLGKWLPWTPKSIWLVMDAKSTPMVTKNSRLGSLSETLTLLKLVLTSCLLWPIKKLHSSNKRVWTPWALKIQVFSRKLAQLLMLRSLWAQWFKVTKYVNMFENALWLKSNIKLIFIIV